MTGSHLRFYHFLAFLTALIWGTTLVSTKILIQNGLTPSEIMLYRFLIAYVVLWIIHPRVYRFTGWKDELLFLGIGFCGGTLYFITENSALEITLASNVALIVTTAPLFTAFLAHLLIQGERLTRQLLIGSVAALIGVAFVVFNGHFILKISPVGDVLSVAAAVSWAFYSVLMRRLHGRFDNLYITRKVFFYGILTILPVFIFHPLHTPVDVLLKWNVLSNLLFLGVIASSVCFVVWNNALKHLGTVRTSNYIYFIPIVTLITSVLVLGEVITVYAMLGTLLILFGVYFVDHELPFTRKH